MSLGTPTPRTAPLGVPFRVMALVAAAFIGSVAGLIWQSFDWSNDEPEEEVVVQDAPAG